MRSRAYAIEWEAGLKNPHLYSFESQRSRNLWVAMGGWDPCLDGYRNCVCLKDAEREELHK